MFYTPQHEELKGRIVCYWLIRTSGIAANTRMLPDGNSDIMLNLGEPYSVTWQNGATQTVEGSALYGQRTKCLLLTQPGEVDMIGIRLQPGTEYLFTGIQASLLANAITPLQNITGTLLMPAMQGLRRQEITDAEKIALVENMMLGMLHLHQKAVPETVATAVKLVLAAKGNIVIEDMLAQAGLCYKQVERLFKNHVGLSPKMFARVHRFYHAFTQVRDVQKADWMQVLYNCGYYDQPHFIKDFRYFSGLSPGRQFAAGDTLDEFFGFT